METQTHGFLFEDKVIQLITGCDKNYYQTQLKNKYTSAWDIQAGFGADTNYSIKACKNGSIIGCGDIVRFAMHCRDTNFTIIVGCWKQLTKTHKQFYRIYEFDISPEFYKIIWSGISIEKLTEFSNYVKSIAAGKDAQMANRKIWKNKRASIYEQYGKGIANIDAKIDSKSQRRTQCSIKIEDLKSAKIPFREYETQYRGVNIPYEQKSEPRTFS
jgi:hypothetical protein